MRPVPVPRNTRVLYPYGYVNPCHSLLMLSEYDLEIRHLKGSANGRADTLSRRPDYDQGSKDNEGVTVLPVLRALYAYA